MRLIRDGEKGGKCGWAVGEGDYIHIVTLSPPVGSDESHFNASLIVRDEATRQCPQTTTFFEEKGEPKRYRAEVLPLTSLTPYRWAKPAH